MVAAKDATVKSLLCDESFVIWVPATEQLAALLAVL